MTDHRWPRWVYGEGEEPDYRFTYANERTFLAWIRTALALLAGGVALDAVDVSIPRGLRIALAVLLVLLGVVCALTAWVRWARSERAMRRGEALPSSLLGAALVGALLVAAVIVLLAVG